MPINLKTHHRLTVVMPNDIYNNFARRFPQCISTFVRNAMVLAVNDKEFFDKVFFKDFSNSEVK